MQRRSFIISTASALSLGALGLSRAGASPARTPSVSSLQARLTAANDALIPDLLRRLTQRGVVVDTYGIPTAQDTARLISVLASARHAPGSRHHRDPGLLDPLERAASALLDAQHDDGTIDLVATNFHSPPDTAFVVEFIAPLTALLNREADPSEARLRAHLEKFLRRAGEALVTGGVHTPNHRWVVCAALSAIHAQSPDPRYVSRINQWLAETIDIDSDGQYTEKSTSVYSPVVDRALLTVARHLNRPDLRDPVRRNLEMTLFYVHPDGEVVTEASKRQDKYQRGSMARYYYSYRTLARLYGNGRFAAMAAQIERTAEAQLTSELLTFLAEPEFAADLPPPLPLPDNYAKVFASSQLARIRRGKVSATILAQNSTLFSFRKGAAALEALRFASAFFGKGQFVGEALEIRNGAYLIEQRLDGPYFQPLSADQMAGGEHVRMAPNGTLAVGGRAARTQSNVQHLLSRATVSEDSGRFRLQLEITGTDGVPVAVELAFRHGGRLEGVTPVEGIANAWLLKSGTGRFSVGEDTITFGPGHVEHTWTQLRGALPQWDGQSVYLTGLTPFQINIEIS
ncbi:MAG: hypothetical protein HS122_13300 [Opitutaceae bacterium]|nr:hypothetical protein [Opitutaceae bacterium]